MLRKVVVCAWLAGALFGCAAQRPPIQTEAALGKVVVYRNGVAYFERHAQVSDGELKLTVPADRVDDFLKSLKVIDSKTSESLPISFKTMTARADQTEMIVTVPGKGPRELSISYVTDSPAWKPSYRIVLGRAPGKAELEAWAVVDNVSGEDWKRVTVGVGSTSALSFRYDLHSVRLVERETLGDEAATAQAPPIGGSPYAVAAAEVPVVAELGGGVVDSLLSARDDAPAPPRLIVSESADMKTRRGGAARPSEARAMKELLNAPSMDGGGYGGLGAAYPGGQDLALGRLAEQIRKQPGKVKLQGFARASDRAPQEDALRRASALRDRLIAKGVPADKVEASGAATVNEAQTVRIIATPQSSAPQQAGRSPEEAKEPIGDAYFVTPVPMTIEKERSAMVSLLKDDTKAERVYYYDPDSNRGSQSYAFSAVRLENPSEYTLDRGPFTIYAEGQFLGEGLSEAIPPKSTAFIPFALDRKLVVEPKSEDRSEIHRLVTIERGIVTAEMQVIRKTVLSLHNRGEKEATVYIRHSVPDGWALQPSSVPKERLAGAYLFPVHVPARSGLEFAIEESQPMQQTIDIRTNSGADSIGLYLKQAKDLAPKLRAELDEVLALYRDMEDVEQKISTLGDQMNEYRHRIDELNVQLVTLRKVNTAQELSRHLAKKMQEISERLQTATIRSADLQEDLMTRRIRVQDKLADLSLLPDDGDQKKVADGTVGS
jgi:hypothetical protein